MRQATTDTGAWTPLRIVCLYALFGVLWILFSDSIVLWCAPDQATLSRLQTYKGWFFILVTASLLFCLISRLAGHRQKILNELRLAEEYNRTLFDLSAMGLALCAMDGRLRDVNPAFAEMLGRTVTDTLRLSYWDITPEKYAEQEQAQLTSLRATGRYGPYEKEYIHQDGHLVAVRLQGRLIENHGEQLIWSSVEDITERKCTEAALRLSEEKFAKTFRNSPDAIALTSQPSGQFFEVNERFLQLSGYALAEIIGRTTLELSLWANLAERQRYVELMKTQGRVSGMEADFQKKSGEIMRGLISGEIIELQGSSYILNVILDITDRWQAEEALRKSTSLLHETQRLSKVGGWEYDIEKRHIAWTEEVYRIHEVTADYDSDNLDSNVTFYAPEAQQLIEAAFRRAVDVGEPYDLVLPLTTALGKRLWVRTIGQAELRDGRPVRVFGYIMDITEAKQAEEELFRHREHLEELVRARTNDLERSQDALQNLLEDVNQSQRELKVANAKLQELDRLKSMFIASMSHELRTPLNSIIGFTGLLLQEMSGAINVEQRDHLERVYRAGKHLLSLITDVIDLAKIESGKIFPHVEQFMLAEVVDEACESLKLQLADKGLALIKIVPETPIRMRSDRRRLLQCLLNFLSNAVKFSEKGTVRIEAKWQVSEHARLRSGKGASEEGAGGDFVEISVTDTGVGIKQEDMPKLFQSFVRLASSMKTTVPGTGLGLYLTKKLASEVLGGEVAAESRAGEGSTFTLRVPVSLEIAT